MGIKTNDAYASFCIEYDNRPYGDNLRAIRDLLNSAEIVVGFNLKFDMHWIRRYCPDVCFPRVWDCQLGEFISTNQSVVFPSLDGSALRRGIGCKLAAVNEYWKLGIDTPDIPYELLAEYLEQDCLLTEQLFFSQYEELVGHKRLLFNLQCEDLKFLQEMEWNGLYYDFAEAHRLADDAKGRIETLNAELFDLAGSDRFDPNSSDQLSCVLYGGTILLPVREKTERVLKDGSIKHGERWGTERLEFQQIVKPLKGTECKPTDRLDKDTLERTNADRVRQGLSEYVRHYSVGEPVIKRLRGTKKAARIIEILLERAYYRKLDSTYYTGLIELKAEKGWIGDKIHGQFNQVVARTGRLSSSSPNLQNFSGDVKELFYSRYANG